MREWLLYPGVESIFCLVLSCGYKDVARLLFWRPGEFCPCRARRLQHHRPELLWCLVGWQDDQSWMHLPPGKEVQKRPAHAKPDFNWLSGPRNGTWKRTCGISCLRSLAPTAPPRQHSPIRRYSGYSATPWYVLIQLPSVIDTISKRWRSKRAFNTSPSHIFP